MTKLQVIRDNFERPDLCVPCGGKCCKAMPGAAFPEDFGEDRESIRANLTIALASGKWAVDWWEGGSRDYFVRPATTEATAMVDPSWGGRCVMLTDAGCSIFEKRPTGCRGLKPSDLKCSAEYGGKYDSSRAWLPYHDLIEAAVTAASWGLL